MEKDQPTQLVPTLALFLTMGALLVGGFYFMRTTALPTPEQQVNKIVDDPTKFYSKNVTVSGEVDDLMGSRAFTIDTSGEVDDDLLVISKKSLEPIGGAGSIDSIYQEDDKVEVNGLVREFRLREVEAMLDVDLVDERFAGWEGKPVVIAESVESTD